MLFSSLSAISSRDVDCQQLSARPRKWGLGRKPGQFFRSAWKKTQRPNNVGSRQELKVTVLWAESDAFRQEVRQETKLEGTKSHKRRVCRSRRNTRSQTIGSSWRPSSEVLWAKPQRELERSKGTWAVVSAIDSTPAKIHQTKAYVFSDSVFVLGGTSDVRAMRRI